MTRERRRAALHAEAARIADRPVTVRCDDGYVFTGVGTDAAGVAFIRRGLAYLDPGCAALYRVSRPEAAS